MPKGYQETKFKNDRNGEGGNLPPVGNGPPGVRSGGTRPTSKPNGGGVGHNSSH